MSERHKAAFTGAGGVWKTAVIEEVEKRYTGPELSIVQEAARVYFRENPGIPEHLRYSFDHQQTIQGMVMNLEVLAHTHEPGVTLTDRSVFDAPVCVASTGDAEGAEILFDDARPWLPGNSEIAYSQIYVLDPEGVPFRNDAERTENEETRQRQHEMFLEFFTEHEIGYTLLSGTLEGRVKQVISEIPNA